MFVIEMRFPLPANRTPKAWGGIAKDSGGEHETEAAALAKVEEFKVKYSGMEYRIVEVN